MTKKILIPLLFLLLAEVQAQEAVLAAGGEATGSGGSASYSIGQVMYTTKGNSIGTVTDGVQQPYEFYISVDKIKGISLTMKVFPNPTDASLFLQIEDLKGEELFMYLYDVQGKLISNQCIRDNSTEVPMQALASGTYLLSVLFEKEPVKTFTIIKKD